MKRESMALWRGWALAAAMAFALSAQAGVSARSYVTDGLVNHWDGLENTGYGAPHDSAATVWTDLRGNVSPELKTTTWSHSAGWARFDATGLVVTQTMGAATAQWTGYGVSEYVRAFTNAFYTAEIAFTQTAPVQTNSINYKSGGYTTMMLEFCKGGGFWYGMKDVINETGTVTSKVLGFTANGSNGTDGGSLNLLLTKSVDVSETRHTFSCSQSNKLARVIVDADLAGKFENANAVTPRDPSSATFQANLTGMRLNRSYYENNGLSGVYHAIRLYDRMLSDAEAYQNAAVDGIRFLGKMAADYDNAMMPTGVRLSTSGGETILERKVAVSVSGYGTVTIDGMTEPDAVWTEAGDVCTAHTVTVTPASGYAFAYWASGVADADATIASGTVHFTGFEPVVAVFRKVQHDGITDGLVYDLNLSLGNGAYNTLVNSGTAGRSLATLGATYAGEDQEHIPSAPSIVRGQPMYGKKSTYRTWILAETPMLHLPQPTYVNGDGNLMTVRQAAHLADDCVDGEIAVHLRFKWDEALDPATSCTVPLFLNGVSDGEDAGLGIYLRHIARSGSESRNYLAFRFGSYEVIHGNGIYRGMKANNLLVPYNDDLTNTWCEIVVSVKQYDPNCIQYDVFSYQDLYIGSGQFRKDLGTFSGILTNGCLKTRSTHRYMALGANFETGGGDTDWQDASASSAALEAFRGKIAECQVWNRALSETESKSLFGEAWRGDRWRIGAKNASGDEFADADGSEAQWTFDPLTMAWRQFPKALTADHPSVTVRTPLAVASGSDSNVVKYLIVETANAVPAGAQLDVTVNGSSVGTMTFPDGRTGVLGIRSRLMRADADGKISIALVRTGTMSGEIAFDRMLLRGGAVVGLSPKSIAGYGLPYDGIGVFTVGDTNVANLASGSTLTNIYRGVALAFDVPEALTNCAITFRGHLYDNVAMVQKASNHLMAFKVYVNGEEAYDEPVGLLAGRTFEFAVPPSRLQPGLNMFHVRNVSSVSALSEKYPDAASDFKDNGYIRFSQFEFIYDKPPRQDVGLLILVR